MDCRSVSDCLHVSERNIKFFMVLFVRGKIQKVFTIEIIYDTENEITKQGLQKS